MSTATKIQEIRTTNGVQAIYKLDVPVVDSDGDETDHIAVSALLMHPEKGTPETIVACVFLCPVHGSHMGSFRPELEEELTIPEYSHAKVLEILGFTIVDELAKPE